MQQVPDPCISTSLLAGRNPDKAPMTPRVVPPMPTLCCQHSVPENVTETTFDICVTEAVESLEGEDSVFLNFDLSCETLLDSDLDPSHGADLDNSQSVVESGLPDTDAEFLPLWDFDCQSPPLGLDLDSRLKEALVRSQRSRRLEPLLKEELRLKILKKRHDSGQDDLDLTISPGSPCQMTAEEYAKRDRRREQNRGAARRFRARKKNEEMAIRKKLETEQQLNSALQAEKQTLQQELTRLRSVLEQHYTNDSCRFFWDHCTVIPVAVDSWAADFRQRDLQCDAM